MANKIHIDIRKAAYELYKQNWVDTHVSPEMRLQSVREYQYYLDDCIADDETPVSLSEWVEENGYGAGSLYVCFDEFLDCEYRDRAYIKSLLKDGSFIEVYEADVRSEQDLLRDIEEIERMSENTPDGQIVDADTILADLIQKCDYEMTGFAQDIFNIWKQSSDKKTVEMMFFEFTDTDFSEYLDLCKKHITGVTKRKKLHTKGKLYLWENRSADNEKTWYTIHEEGVCNSLEEICYAYGGKEIELVNEVIKRGNKVVFTDNATYEEYISQFEDCRNVENPIYPYCCFETYEKAKEIWDLLSV